MLSLLQMLSPRKMPSPRQMPLLPQMPWEASNALARGRRLTFSSGFLPSPAKKVKEPFKNDTKCF